ncbi:hypothetical protein GCM10011587_14240 [Pyruvatibacter mobilis]|nr:hypothetical protein GCM10011587_14240 [Pyruvatibacter mobilis]
MVVLSGGIEAAFCCQFFPALGDQAARMRPVPQGNGQHFIRSRHFKIERQSDRTHQTINITVRDMTAIFAQMRSDPVCPSLRSHFSCAHRVRVLAAPSIPDGGHVIYVDAKAQG